MVLSFIASPPPALPFMSPTPENQSISEITFTRSRHALILAMLALTCLLASVALCCLRWKHLLYKDQTMTPPALWLCLLPLVGFIGLGYAAWLHLRRPFLVVSRLGLEIHTLIEREEIDHITWVEIQRAEAVNKERLLVLTLNTEDENKVHITLAPIDPRARQLLMTALGRIMEFRAKQVAENG